MDSKQALFAEMNDHLLQDDQPSHYFNGLLDQGRLTEYPFTMLNKLQEAAQSPKHHPEGNVWNHTMLVMDAAAQVKDQSSHVKEFMWAALLHDIGKPDTTKVRKGKITSYDHDKLGAAMTQKFLAEFNCPANFIKTVAGLVRWHMQILFVVNDLPFADIKTMLQQADIQEVALLGLCDRLGRLNVDKAQEEKNIALFVQKCKGDRAARTVAEFKRK